MVLSRRFRYGILGLTLLMGVIGLAASRPFWGGGTRVVSSSEWLPIDIPCDLIALEGGQTDVEREAVVDLPLSADAPVQLLVSSLGPSHHVAETVASIEEIRPSQLRFRPSPVQELRQSSMHSDARAFNRERAHQIVADAAHMAANRNLPATVRDFWIHVTADSLEDRRGYQQITANLASHTDSVQIYVDRSVIGQPQVLTQARQIVELLEQEVLPAIQDNLGPIADIEGQGRMTVLMTPWLGRLQGGITNVKGFVRGSDFQKDLTPPFSNQAAVLYLNTDLPSGTGLKTLLLHEVAHAAIFSLILRQSDRPQAIENWLNEGLAHLTERSLGGDWSNLDYRVARYYQRPETFPLAVADYYRSSRWRDHGCRGAVFLFFNHLGTQGETARSLLQRFTDSPNSRARKAEFSRDFRNWAISLARISSRTESSATSSQVGRYLNSGPRFHVWNVTEQTSIPIKTIGTATQFIELRSKKSGWFRVRIPTLGVDNRWQITILKPRPGSPNVALAAKWELTKPSSPDSTDSADAQLRLVLSTSEALPSGWHWDAVSCEGFQGDERHVQTWNLNDPDQSPLPDQPVWSHGSGELTLTPSNLKPHVDRVIKVRLQGPEGRTAWIWADVPDRPARGPIPFATGGVESTTRTK